MLINIDHHGRIAHLLGFLWKWGPRALIILALFLGSGCAHHQPLPDEQVQASDLEVLVKQPDDCTGIDLNKLADRASAWGAVKVAGTVLAGTTTAAQVTPLARDTEARVGISLTTLLGLVGWKVGEQQESDYRKRLARCGVVLQ